MALVLHRHDLARRSPVVALILVLHGAFLYVLATGIRFELPRIPPPLELIEVPDLARPAEPLPADPGPPDTGPAERPVIAVALPRVEFADEPLDVEALPALPPVTRGGQVTPAARVVAPASDPRRPMGRPPYPAQSARLGEEGLVRVSACVLPDGRLADVALAASSGHRLLDQAALHHVGRAGVRLAPGTRDGVPVRMCTTIPVRFTLLER